MSLRKKNTPIALIIFLTLAVPCFGEVLFPDGFEYNESVTLHGWEFHHRIGDEDSVYTSSVIANEGERSLYMESLDGDEQKISHFFENGETDLLIEVYMHDDVVENPGWNLVAIDMGQGAGGYDAHLGISDKFSELYYTSGGNSMGDFEPTTFPRSHGWHKLSFIVTSAGTEYYIDDVLVRTKPYPTEIDTLVLMCGNYLPEARLGEVYFDSVKIRRLGALEVNLDIKPGSCPNPLNRKGGGVLPVAIAGDGDLDVHDIDVSTIELVGVSPLRDSIDDVATPIYKENGSCECAALEGDGTDDLTLKFDKKSIRSALGDLEVGDDVLLTITGQLLNGEEFHGEDCVRIVGN